MSRQDRQHTFLHVEERPPAVRVLAVVLYESRAVRNNRCQQVGREEIQERQSEREREVSRNSQTPIRYIIQQERRNLIRGVSNPAAAAAQQTRNSVYIRPYIYRRQRPKWNRKKRAKVLLDPLVCALHSLRQQWCVWQHLTDGPFSPALFTRARPPSLMNYSSGLMICGQMPISDAIELVGERKKQNEKLHTKTCNEFLRGNKLLGCISICWFLIP